MVEAGFGSRSGCFEKCSVTVKDNEMRIIILGAGAVVRSFYLPALERLKWTQDILVVDASCEALKALQAEFPWAQVREGTDVLLNHEPEFKKAYDAVVIALPNALHVSSVIRALEAGFPVLCEKPLALSETDCRKLGDVAAACGLTLAVGMVRRHSAAAKAVSRAIKERFLGDLLEVDVDHGGPYAWTSVSGAFFRRENGGILADLGVHHLDWIASMIGRLEPVSYQDDSSGGVEASCEYRLKSQAGVKVRLSLSHRFKRPDVTRFICERGSIILRKSDFESCSWLGQDGLLGGQLSIQNAFSNPAWPLDFVSCFAEQFKCFYDTINEKPQPIVTAHEAAETMALIESAYQARTHKPSLEVNSERPVIAPGRCVITGGTGFIGTALLERLTQIGFDDLVVPVRGYQTCASAARFPVQLPKVDLSNRQAVRECVKGARWIFHLALGVAGDEAFRITVDGTRILVEEAEAAGVEAIIILSTSWVYGQNEKPSVVDEKSPYDPAGGIYGSSKAVMQKNCLRYAQKMKKTRLVVLNPSCVYGPEGKTFTLLPGELAAQGQFAWVQSGSGTVNYVYIDNLLDAMLLAATHQQAHGKAWLVSDGTCSWRDFLAHLLPKPADEYPDYPVDYFRRLQRESKMTFKQLLRQLLAFPPLRRWLRERSIVSWLRKVLPIKKVENLSSEIRQNLTATQPVPAAWLVDLYGLSHTVYDSTAIRGLGWKSTVTLAQGMKYTQEWLALHHNK